MNHKNLAQNKRNKNEKEKFLKKRQTDKNIFDNTISNRRRNPLKKRKREISKKKKNISSYLLNLHRRKKLFHLSHRQDIYLDTRKAMTAVKKNKKREADLYIKGI